MSLKGLIRKIRFPFYSQYDRMDCGPTCLRMVASYYGKDYSLQYLREKCYLNREGVSMAGISDAAEAIGLRALAIKTSLQKLIDDIKLPCIAHWNQNHFIVVYKIKDKKIYVADPGYGLISLTPTEFASSWKGADQNEGYLLVLEPGPDFITKDENANNHKSSLKFLFPYLSGYRTLIFQLFLGMIAGSLLQLFFPFLTQSLVDFGINNRDIGFVYLILIGQLMLFMGQTSVDLIRGWILLHIGTRVNISIISDFLKKLMRLPLSFFDTKMIGDILQRVFDQKRIESFLTYSTLSILFSMINLIVFGIVMAIYSIHIFYVFLVGSVVVSLWITIFLKKRKEIDYKRFSNLSENQSSLVQLITGIQEIKLNNSEHKKRSEWEEIQGKLYEINTRSLTFNQYQQSGMMFINQLKNIIITFIAAKQVIDGNITLGMMLAISFINGQLNAPIEQLLGFIYTVQDAKLSMGRLKEIQSAVEEDAGIEVTHQVPENKNLSLESVSFMYSGPHSEPVLENLSLQIPQGKVTAIVGTSGSGKTTLLKLLLKFYEPTSGRIMLGNIGIRNIDTSEWRRHCGVVMQDGYIFSESILNNIVMGDEAVDEEKLHKAVFIANIEEFIESLPLKYSTKIGVEGHGLSQGQRQRVLIARAVYKDPEYIFFDEATNSLDAQNERVIMENLDDYFVNRTVIIVAHRLSTVRNADQIVVLEKGKIIQRGNHEELTRSKGAYYKLVKNQLELGS